MEDFQIAKLQKNATQKQTTRSRVFPPQHTYSPSSPTFQPPQTIPSKIKTSPRKMKRIVPFISENLSPVKRDEIQRSKSASPTGRKEPGAMSSKKLSSRTKLLVQQLKEKEKAKQVETDNVSNKSLIDNVSSNDQDVQTAGDEQVVGADLSLKTEGFNCFSVLSTEEKLVFDKYVKCQ